MKMAEKKKHKKRKQHLKDKKNNNQVQASAEGESGAARESADSEKATKADAKAAKKAAKKQEKQKGKDGKARKPSLWQRFVNYCKAVKSEMQRVVWPTRQELINASLIVVGAIIFFGVLIGIIDNIVVIPLDWIGSLGV